MIKGRPNLTIICCSGSKERHGNEPGTRTIADSLQSHTVEYLRRARAAVKLRAQLDESTSLPAWKRYKGPLYSRAAEALQIALSQPQHLLILSGGYGVVLADEAIGWYEAPMTLSWWPKGLLERCILEYATKHSLDSMVAIAGNRTAYAALLRRVQWRHGGFKRAVLFSPDLRGEKGAMRKSPVAQGEALRQYLEHGLDEDWRSTAGYALREENLL